MPAALVGKLNAILTAILKRPDVVDKLGDLAATAGLRRIAILAWRDLDDPEAGGSELHASHVASLWAHLREMNRAECFPPTPELAQAYSEHAPAMSLVGWFSRGILYAEKSLAMRKDFGDIWGQGQSLHFYGIVLYAASRFQDCITRCREAISLRHATKSAAENFFRK